MKSRIGSAIGMTVLFALTALGLWGLSLSGNFGTTPERSTGSSGLMSWSPLPSSHRAPILHSCASGFTQAGRRPRILLHLGNCQLGRRTGLAPSSLRRLGTATPTRYQATEPLGTQRSGFSPVLVVRGDSSARVSHDLRRTPGDPLRRS
jgi:hypothetical protein